MDEPSRVTALLAFNLGVELGQVAVAVVIVLALMALRRGRQALAPRALRRWASACIAVLGLVWFVQRL